MNVGEIFTLTLPVKRKWWQFWNPRVSDVTRVYRVRCAVTGEGEVDWFAPWPAPFHFVTDSIKDDA